MNVLEKMKNDVYSVLGLNVEYDFGGTRPITSTIADARIKEYKVILDGEEFTGKNYLISFIDCPWSFYGVYENNIKVLD